MVSYHPCQFLLMIHSEGLRRVQRTSSAHQLSRGTHPFRGVLVGLVLIVSQKASEAAESTELSNRRADGDLRLQDLLAWSLEHKHDKIQLNNVSFTPNDL